MMEIIKNLDQIAEADSNVIIYGESGTGKELIARGIHSFSGRRDKPLVCINCASLPETLLESELFGYERGAFTGAHARKLGKFEIANHGTVFLDEIGDISLAAQAKILRVIQEGDFHRVGGTKEVNVDVRIIAATNKDLRKAIQDKSFRDDLYYRLKVIEISLPPLRERPEDISLLIEYFLKTLKMKIASNVEDCSAEAMEILLSYGWPGNVRELRNVIERALVFARGEKILPQHLPKDISMGYAQEAHAEGERPASLDEIERLHILRVLDFTGGNKQNAAKILGISRATLYEKIKSYKS
jgi:transcriptional regulator with PAS, ATPase and Fis domain